MAFEGLWKEMDCHMKETIPAEAVEMRSGGYHFLGWKRLVLLA